MKKRAHLLLLILLLSVPTVSQAEDISLDKARKVAETFFNRYGVSTRSSSQLTLVNANEVAATRSASEVAFYIFNRQGGGFAIVSALDAACPILGYSLDHEFGTGDDMPANLAEWLDLYRQQISERRRSGRPATAEELARWNEASFQTRADLPASVFLNTAEWGQGAPYNGLCPLDTAGKKCITGCTNTAISQVMYYHQHPKAGTGTLPSYTKNGITSPSIKLGHEYKWDKMIHKYKGATYTQEQADAVARLMYDVAVMGQASFGSSATSTSTTSAAPRLRTYFGYDAGMIRYARNYTDDAMWKALMKEEIGNRRPIIMTASSASGGSHAFVVDGYDSNDRFHVNWGWNGSSNGYYYISAFGSYTIGQVIWTGLKPNEGNPEYYNLALRNTTQSGINYKGIEYMSGSATPGSAVSVRFGAVYNYSISGATFSGVIGFGHYSKDGVLKGMMECTPELKFSSLSSGSYSWSSTTRALAVTQPIERGDYIEALYKPEGKSEWQHFYNAGNPDDDIIGRMPLHIKDFSSIKYALGSRKLVICTFTGSKFTITDKDGNTVRSGNIGNTSYNINLTDTERYPSGKYKVTVTCGEQSFSFDLIL